MNPFVLPVEYRAAGILPYTFLNNEILILLGLEPGRNAVGAQTHFFWSDFGGRKEQDDPSAMHTAAREFSEETLGIYGDFNVEVSSVQKSQQFIVDLLQNGNGVYCANCDSYVMFLVPLTFIDEFMFCLAHTTNQMKLSILGAEKSDFAWVPMQKLLSAIQNAPESPPDESKVRLKVMLLHQHRTMFILSRTTESLLALAQQDAFTQLEQKLIPKSMRTLHVFDSLEVVEEVEQHNVNWKVVRRLLSRKVRGTRLLKKEWQRKKSELKDIGNAIAEKVNAMNTVNSDSDIESPHKSSSYCDPKRSRKHRKRKRKRKQKKPVAVVATVTSTFPTSE